MEKWKKNKALIKAGCDFRVDINYDNLGGSKCSKDSKYKVHF
jgi:hypothetical protein